MLENNLMGVESNHKDMFLRLGGFSRCLDDSPSLMCFGKDSAKLLCESLRLFCKFWNLVSNPRREFSILLSF